MNIATHLKRLGATDEMIARALCNGKPIAQAGANPKRNDPYKSKWERLYAAELNDAMRAGEVLAWEYEAVTFRLARSRDGKRGASYTPDFLVVHKDGRLEFVEVKGFMREAARVRFVTARDRFPWFDWRMIRRTKSVWEEVM